MENHWLVPYVGSIVQKLGYLGETHTLLGGQSQFMIITGTSALPERRHHHSYWPIGAPFKVPIYIQLIHHRNLLLA